MGSSLNTRRAVAFTLVELLVSMAVLSLLLVVLASMATQISTAWRSTKGKIEQFRQARDAFEAMSRRVSQSTLNTYWDYLDAGGNTRTTNNSASFVPFRYARQSELRFISGPGLASIAGGTDPRPTHSIFFLAPLGVVDSTDYGGLQNLLNTWGYYLEYADDSKLRPPFLTASLIPLRSRFRLMELMQPSESMSIYNYTSGSSTYNGKEWFTDALTIPPVPVHVLAENVIALVLLPKLTPQEDTTGTTLSPNYTYDSTVKRATAAINSKNQLPPVVQMTVVAIDEVSANRLTDGDNADIATKLGGLFTIASLYADDLATLEKYLVDKRINYRIFTTNISIKGAKWSREQIN
ncbi:MAG: Verru_Chthon cassette protein C [Verrucomicrobiae bacterium]